MKVLIPGSNIDAVSNAARDRAQRLQGIGRKASRNIRK